ncbi:hypothetical protein [Rossellomorea aquimaris]|uniref:hypothetical protein n=1 Tax=Rossellomorea aquimaris TaxID=189382 RepID=UPI001653EACB|nr:hypothetical protein [Rossellomorea aquimaris]
MNGYYIKGGSNYILILFAMGAIAESDKKAQNQHAYTFIFTVSMTVMVFFLL